MSTVTTKDIFQAIEEMSENMKENILESCVSSENDIYDSIYGRFGLNEWFDVYVCSEEFASLSIETKKKVVKNFRGLHSFLENLNANMGY